MRVLLGLILSLLLLGSASAQVPKLGDKQVAAIIEGAWNKLMNHLALGEREVVPGIPTQQCTSDQINIDQFEYLLDAEAAGYVAITYSDEFGDRHAGKISSREAVLKLAAAGEVGLITVASTPKAVAEQLTLTKSGRTTCLSFKTGSYVVEKVVRNEPKSKGPARFRAVEVLYRADLERMTREIQTASRHKRDTRRKAIVLLGYNTAHRRWNIVAFDAANLNDDFQTKTVASFLEVPRPAKTKKKRPQ